MCISKCSRNRQAHPVCQWQPLQPRTFARLHPHPLQARLQQEHERSQHYLDPSTRRPLVHEAEQQLVAAHLPTLLAKGSFAALVDAQVGQAVVLDILYRLWMQQPQQLAWGRGFRICACNLVLVDAAPPAGGMG